MLRKMVLSLLVLSVMLTSVVGLARTFTREDYPTEWTFANGRTVQTMFHENGSFGFWSGVNRDIWSQLVAANMIHFPNAFNGGVVTEMAILNGRVPDPNVGNDSESAVVTPVTPTPPTSSTPTTPIPPHTDNEVLIRIDGEFVQIPHGDQTPIIVDGRTLVPLRVVMERLGFRVEWNQVSSNAHLTRANDVVSVTIDQSVMFVNGRSVLLDVPARIVNNRTLVPVRAISEATGMTVDWDGVNRIVDVRTARVMTLPNRRLTNEERREWIEIYNYNGGASEFELEVVRLVNEQRTIRGLSPLSIDVTFMLPARFYAQTLSDLNLPLGHREGPYGGSANTVTSFGGSTAGWRNGAAGHHTPESLVNAWMNSPGHRDNILIPGHTRIGAGSFGRFHYLVLAGGDIQQPFVD